MTPADFRAIRHALGLTQSEWGRWLGVTPQHVAKMERSAATITPTIALLASAYADGWRPQDA